MIGYTADLGKCLRDAESLHVYTCYVKVSLMWGIPSGGDDAVNRMRIRVVATVVLVSGDACRASSLLYCFRAYYSYCQGLG
jgi:hypothetical protein